MMESGERSPERERDPRITEGVKRFFDAFEKGEDYSAVYLEFLQAHPDIPEEDFNAALGEEAAKRGIDFKWASDPRDSSDIEAQEADAVEEKREISEWEELKKKNPDGDGTIDGKKYWRSPDGSGYIQARGRIPIRVVHGEKSPTYRVRRTGERTNAFWDGAKGTFVKDDPTPEVREERKRARDALRSASNKVAQWSREKAQGDPDVISDEEREGIQANLFSALEDREIPTDIREELLSKIEGLTSRSRTTEILDLLKKLPPRIETSSDGKKAYAAGKGSQSETNDVTEKKEDTDTSSKTADGITVKELGKKLDNSKEQRLGAKQRTSEERDLLDQERDNFAAGTGRGRHSGESAVDGTGPIFEGAKDLGVRDWEFDRRDYIDTKVVPLKKIANDPIAADYFGKLISSMDPVNAARILADMTADRPLTRRESRMVLYAQHEYSRRNQEWAKYKDHITMSDLKNIAARNEVINEIMHSVGEEEALEFFKNELLENGMRDKDVFDNSIRAIKSLKDDRSTLRYKAWDRNVRELCARYKLQPEHFNDMFDMSTPEGVEKARAKMEERLHEKAGKWNRALDWVSKHVTHTNILGSSGQKARDAVADAQYLRSKEEKSWLSPTSLVLNDLNENFNVLTNVMSLSINEPEVAARIHQSSMRNTKPSFDRDGGPKSYSEMTENLNAQLSDAKVKEMWERHKKKIKNSDGVTWDDMDQTQRRQARDSWEPSEVKQQQKGLGLWALIFSALTGEVFKQQKEKLSTE